MGFGGDYINSVVVYGVSSPPRVSTHSDRSPVVPRDDSCVGGGGSVGQ